MKRESYLWDEELNQSQKEAVKQFNGASLIIAGAGSGKTRVIAYRIANIIQNGIAPSSILALTFTNKAAKEMKERISSLVEGNRARGVWMGTFHSIFVRFLREYASLLGFSPNFTIYNQSNSKSLYKECIKELNLDDKLYKVSKIYSRISFAKNNLVTAQRYSESALLQKEDAKGRVPRIGDIYTLYSSKCRQAQAMDFDDILLYTNILLRDFPEVLQTLQNRFQYILVDEYQDTNYAQYLIIKKLSAIHRNLCVVGDDSQSIYAFRGARIENILNFNRDFPEAKEFRLEQNYRSTQMIVNAANSLIAKNPSQLKKRCFSKGEVGEKIKIWSSTNDKYEADEVAERMLSATYKSAASFNSFAVLYRTNAQARVLEESLRKRSIPYKLYGGHSFYDYVEVQDMIAYFRLIVNRHDNEAFKRVVNRPSRKIGDTTIDRLLSFAGERQLSLWDGVRQLSNNMDSHSIRAATVGSLNKFCDMIEGVAVKLSSSNAYDIAYEIYLASGYSTWLKGDNSTEGLSRVRNVEELFNSIASFIEEVQNSEDGMEDEGSDPSLSNSFEESLSLSSFLERVSLLSSVDSMEEELEEGAVTLMTIHSAKGLEFDHLFVVGCEENLFPSCDNLSNSKELEEERRLMYVAITRAKKELWLSCAESRFRWGSYQYNQPSRFLNEIDKRFVELSSSLTFRMGRVPEKRESSGLFSPPRSNSTATPTLSSFRNSVRAPIPPPNPNFKADHYSTFKEGQRVEHDRFGHGTILQLEGQALKMKAIVEFDLGGKKTLLLKFAKIRAI
ncbi:MAG: UvrD-helicase domain-containing protein [Bacteroidales bacterium]